MINKTLIIVTFALWICIVFFLRESSAARFWILNFVGNLGLYGFIVFVVMQSIFAAFLLPCSVFTLVAGSIWGWEKGFVISIIATLISSTTTYFLGRYFFSKTCPEVIIRAYKKIPRLASIGSFLASVLVHINPIFPASALGYFFGINKLRFIPYILGCLVGTIPLQFIFVYLSGLIVNK